MAWELSQKTSVRWAEAALADPVRLLDDHAHLERKAASNALDLVGRWPEQPTGGARGKWVPSLGRIVRDEALHLSRVLTLLESRGGAWSKEHKNPYAQGLRKAVRIGKGPEETVDRLLVSALIEARSHDRFQALAKVAPADLRELYRGLEQAEAGHFRVFLDLAHDVREADEVRARWDRLVAHEAQVLAEQEPGPRIHSGEPR